MQSLIVGTLAPLYTWRGGGGAGGGGEGGEWMMIDLSDYVYIQNALREVLTFPG